MDELAQPISGVNVREKGTDNGITTDLNGNYVLSVPNDQTIISFTFIGYESHEIQAKYIPTGSVITLKASETNLKEVVINKGYYDERRALSTGDVSTVSGKFISQQPVSDPILALEGRVPGLYIAQALGLPGAYSTIQLRGQNSIANGNDPLYLIDGVPFNSTSLSSTVIGSGAFGTPLSGPQRSNAGISPFSALNPEDIENITILKDADATAIYGSRGANGVILITTKKGKAGKTEASFDISEGSRRGIEPRN